MQAPLTTAKLGSSRCVGCERLFSATSGEVVELEVQEAQRNRYGGFSGPQGTRTARRRWHAACLEEFEASNAAYRQQVADDHERIARELCEAAGVNYDELVAKQAAERAELERA